MIEGCHQRNNVKLMIAYRLHFEEINLKAVDLVRRGRIGKPKFFNSSFAMTVRPNNVRTKKEVPASSAASSSASRLSSAYTNDLPRFAGTGKLDRPHMTLGLRRRVSDTPGVPQHPRTVGGRMTLGNGEVADAELEVLLAKERKGSSQGAGID